MSTPKGEASKSLGHAKSTLRDLERIVDPNRVEEFVYRLNDFLRTARTVPEFLSKEPRGSVQRVYTTQHRGVPAMRHWVEGYANRLSPEDRERLDLLTQLRQVSTHDLAIRPHRGAISVEVYDSRTGAGDSVANLLYQHDYGSPGADEDGANQIGSELMRMGIGCNFVAAKGGFTDTIRSGEIYDFLSAE